MSENFGPPLELFRSMSRLRKAWHDITPAPEINKSLFGVLMTIAHAQDSRLPYAHPVVVVDNCVSLTDIAMIMRQSLPVVSQRATALEKLGYIYRLQDSTDRRISRVGLTESGTALVQRAHTCFEEKLNHALHSYGDSNVAALINMLDRLSGVLEDAEINYILDKEQKI
ncbi:MAG: MarR family transcriptional regulator [Oscillospiraceae bacterium]